MKLLFDQCLSRRLIAVLGSIYPGSQHVSNSGMETATDDVIWNYAREKAMIIVSKDSDFYYRSMLFGHPPKVVWIRLGNCTSAEVSALLQTREADLLTFQQDSSASFLVLP